MLASLSIQNVVLIEKLNIEFQEGLCVLTGETGAGKSILLDALGLALGARSEAGLVRKGADAAQVSAEFQVGKDHPCINILHNANLGGGAGSPLSSLILRRAVGADGRSRAFINDQPVSIGLLRQVGESLVEIHGQFETQGLLDPATHRELLDEYAGVIHSLQGAWQGWKKAEEDHARLKEDAQKSRSEENYLRQAVEDLDSLSPQAGEEEKLNAQRGRLMHREKVIAALNAAYAVLSGEDDPVRKTWGILDRVADKMGEAGRKAIEALARASAETEEALALIQSLSADMEEGGESLESIDERLHELRAQARKHQCTVDELAGVREKLAAKLNLIERTDDVLAAAAKETEKAKKEYVQQAQRISAERKKAAKKLDTLVQRELSPLKMEKAKFVTAVEDVPESEWGPAGIDRVRFLVATNPGAAPGPLNKIASGGEMARFMLALKVVMGEVGSQSLIFDEADSGIGGAVADAVGERLARLAKARQVLVVTHSPQVAARAGHHYIVRKDGVKDVKTDVVYLEKDKDRREEIARMLSGATVTKEARAAAERLLETGT
ncbi:MAG: DNA repair protein RecN [Alphaproteobacteria bacterium]|nr:DNA repair protein RecN [Alphaproteobacteria bacterium]